MKYMKFLKTISIKINNINNQYINYTLKNVYLKLKYIIIK